MLPASQYVGSITATDGLFFSVLSAEDRVHEPRPNTLSNTIWLTSFTHLCETNFLDESSVMVSVVIYVCL